MKILGISGSLRQGSFNTALLNTIKNMPQDRINFEITSIDKIPFYNEDLDGDQKPGAVQKLIANIASADGILFATPEYNHSIPAVLKNAIDWASRPSFQSCLQSKPCGIISASKSPVGGARVQEDLKVVLASTLSIVYPSIEYLLPSAHEMFNDSGELTNEQAQRRLTRYFSGFTKWIEKQD